MQQQLSVITLGIRDPERSRRFYEDGFGWRSVFANDEIRFYQMNGFVLGLWLASSLDLDMGRSNPRSSSAFALAHNVPTQADVEPTIEALIRAGGRLLRAADAPPHGGYRGYVADPDDHAWEIAWNPAWKIDADGHVTFST